MKSRLFPVVWCALALALSGVPAFAQEAEQESEPVNPLEADAEAEPELTWSDYTVKAYSIQLFGGAFGGAEYLNLPVKPDRTYVAPGSDLVMSYDGTWWETDELNYNIYDGPIKTIEDGYTLGLKVASYLADDFHLDLVFSYSATEAVLTMVNLEDPENTFREEIDRDAGVQVFRGALEMTYDFDSFRVLGIYPYLGFGFGGVINRFSNLEDVNGLFLLGTAGLQRHVAGTASVFLEFDFTTFSMGRDELHYTKSVNYTDIAAGVSFFIDRVPPEIRTLHESETAAKGHHR